LLLRYQKFKYGDAELVYGTGYGRGKSWIRDGEKMEAQG